MWTYTVAEYAWLRFYVLVTAGLFFLASVACFVWSWLQDRKLAVARYKIVCEAIRWNGWSRSSECALEPIVIDATRRELLSRLLTGARPGPIGQQAHLWYALQQMRIIEGDFYEPKGLASGFEPALIKWLEEHPSNY